MAIQFSCPHCKTSTLIDEQFAGQSGPCRQCGQTVTVATPVVGARDNTRGGGGAAVVLIAVAGVVGVVGLLLCGGLMFYGVRVSSVPVAMGPVTIAASQPCMDNLRRIGVAMHNYHAAHGSLPPAYVADADGKPMHSWRVLLLPYLGARDVYDEYRFDEPWDGPNNILLSTRIAGIYQCPEDSLVLGTQNTSYVVVGHQGGIFDASKSCGFADIVDGLTNTLLVVEVSGANIQCLEPRDLDATKMTFQLNMPGGQDISSQHPVGPYVLMADGSVRQLPLSMPVEQVQAMISKAGGEAVFLP